MSAELVSVWTQLHVGGKPVGTPEKVKGNFVDVSEFKEFVKAKWANRLLHSDAPDLEVFAFAVSTAPPERKEELRLEGRTALTNYITSENMPLLAFAPAPSGSDLMHGLTLQTGFAALLTCLPHVAHQRFRHYYPAFFSGELARNVGDGGALVPFVQAVVRHCERMDSEACIDLQVSFIASAIQH